MADHGIADRYTLGHLAFGLILGVNGVSTQSAIVLAVLWELIDRPARNIFPMIVPKSTPKSLEYSALNIGATLAGYAATRGLLPPKTEE